MPEKLDNPGFEKLFKKLYPPLCRYCCQFVRNTVLAEEIVQEKFLFLWERKDSLKIRTSYESFMYTAVRNQSIDYLRSRAAKLSLKHEELSDEIHDDTDPLKSIEYRELEHTINQVIESLPEKCFIIFSLKRFGGLKNAEIAQELRLSEKTVLNQLTRAKNLVKAALAKYDNHLPLIL
jgi:RNA polymerase sigma-70 factor (ECF subfamily)